ncbi:protein kinase domain-containing protein [Marinobacter subterrani]|uniref:Protein kinase domain n=1 Tax=Marinobacter subterrani TaxID=1658765 RepID=A0A0J7J875_9GAMM|nr:hypothetical protein [Marinobacter subterrani]KMQ74402.1 Protein kinase domain [Marinobacter subterrani]
MPSTTLQGNSTPCGWFIREKVDSKQVSGGNFCARYIVESEDGQIAFMKAMDLTRALNSPLEQLQSLISEYLFEQSILEYCKEQKMSKVVVPLSAGEMVNNQFQAPLNRVFYIVFEKAEADLRQKYLVSKQDEWLPFFRAIHHICIAAEQLHRAGIAHQDIKPSNILHFTENQSKLADLGRVTDIEGRSPFCSLAFPGDRRYAPIEVRFNVTPREFQDRYLSDMWAIGSLIYQTLMGSSVTHILAVESQKILPNVFSLRYSEALPVLYTSFSTMMGRFEQICSGSFGENIGTRISDVVSEMCHPDFERRGAPNFSSKASRPSIRRYTGKMSGIIRQFIIEGRS